MKTISELNSRWWYRLIKVIYILFLLFFIIGLPTSIFYSYDPEEYDDSKSYIQCLDGKKFVLSENKIVSIMGQLNTYNSKKANDLCSYIPLNNKFSEYGEPILYEFVNVYKNRDWLSIVSFSALSILGTILFFELIRRIFYYIILGNIKPKKHSDA